MTAQDAMKQLVADELQPTFKARGYKKKAFTFYRRAGDNFALVQLEKSRESTAESLDFAINLGVYSARLQRGLTPLLPVPDVGQVPSEPACHLRQRIGRVAEGRSKWWTVREETDQAELGATVRSVLEKHAFPFLDARITDEGLRDHWRTTLSRAKDGVQLAVLLRDIGPLAQLAPLLERLRRDTPPTATDLIAAIEKLVRTVQPEK